MQKQIRKPRKKAAVWSQLCVACGCCVSSCPRQAIHIRRGIYASIDEAQCIGCGQCVRDCPASVIALKEVEA